MLNLSFSSIFVSSPKLKGPEAGLGREGGRAVLSFQHPGTGISGAKEGTGPSEGAWEGCVFTPKRIKSMQTFLLVTIFLCAWLDKTPVSYNPELFALFPARTWAPLPVPQLDWTDSRARSLLTCSGTTSHLCPTALALLPAREPRHWTSRSVRCLNLQVLA